MGRNYQAHPYEVVVRIERVWDRERTRSSKGDPLRDYRAYIYGTLPELQFPSVSTGDGSQVAGLPLTAVESMSIDWGQYESYAASFAVGRKLAEHMRTQLFQALSSGLEGLLDGHIQAQDPLRIWWDCRAPELDQLPWELVAYRTGSRAGRDVFVRGRPPATPPPVLPVGDTLRLAVIQDAAAPDDVITRVLDGVPGLEVMVIHGEVRDAIREAADMQVELLHFVCDAYQTRSQEGVLYFPHAEERHLPVSELSRLLYGSRVTAIGLTSYRSTDVEQVHFGGKTIPAVYHGFASLAASNLGLPSVIAPLGPVEGGYYDQVSPFWRRFYETLAQELSLERAMTRGYEGSEPLPIAMWLRHPFRRCFRRDALADVYQVRKSERRGSRSDSTEIEPSEAEVAFEVSQDLVKKLKGLKGIGELPESVKKFLTEETERQTRLDEVLKPWLTEEEP